MLVIFIIIVIFILVLCCLYYLVKLSQRAEKGLTPHPYLISLNRLRQRNVISNEEYDQVFRKINEKIDIAALEEDLKFVDFLEKNNLLTASEIEEIREILIELVKKYQLKHSTDSIHLRETFQESDLICYPEELDERWICVCGTENKNDDNNCLQCHRNKKYVFRKYIK